MDKRDWFNFLIKRKIKFSVYIRDGKRCFYCSNYLAFYKATLDHIIPISKGGKTSEDNIVLCCRSCNTEKGNGSANQFLISKLGPLK